MDRSQGEIASNYENWLQRISARVYEGEYVEGTYLNEKGMPKEGHNYTQEAKKGDYIIIHADSKIDGGIKTNNGLAVVPAKNVTGVAKIVGELWTVPGRENKKDAYNKDLTQGYRQATVKFYGMVKQGTLTAEHPQIVPYDYLTIKPGTNEFTKANNVTPFMSMVKVDQNRGQNILMLVNPQILTIGA